MFLFYEIPFRSLVESFSQVRYVSLLLDYGAGWRLAGGGEGGGLWGYWTVEAVRGWQGLVALAGLNRPMGSTITKIARKVAQTTLLLCVLREIALSFCWSHYFVLLTFHKMLLWNYDEEIKQISSGSANHNYWYLEIFAGIAIKLEKVGPTFSSFNPCPSLASVATFDRKQFQYLNIVLNNKTGPLLSEFSWREDTIQLFKKMANSVTL